MLVLYAMIVAALTAVVEVVILGSLSVLPLTAGVHLLRGGKSLSGSCTGGSAMTFLTTLASVTIAV